VRLTPSATIELIDLNSTNGTWVDGQRLTGATTVTQGRPVKLGTTTLCVVGSPGAGPLTPPTIPARRAPVNPFPDPAGHGSYITAGRINPLADPAGQGSYITAGPMAGGNIAMSGETVAGRDLYYHDAGFRIRSRMRPAARKLLWVGIALFFLGVAVSLVALAAFNNELFNGDVSSSGPSDEVVTAFAVFLGGMALNLIGIICIVISLVMRRDKVAEPVPARHR
jgi:uncharacterized membrane protein (DUF485 family)